MEKYFSKVGISSTFRNVDLSSSILNVDFTLPNVDSTLSNINSFAPNIVSLNICKKNKIRSLFLYPLLNLILEFAPAYGCFSSEKLTEMKVHKSFILLPSK